MKIFGMTKGVEVKSNVRNNRMFNDIQLTLMKMQDDETDKFTEREALEAEQGYLDKIENFFIKILKLNEKQITKLEDLSIEELSFAFGEFMLRLNGAKEADIQDYYKSIKDDKEEAEKNPKAEENTSTK